MTESAPHARAFDLPGWPCPPRVRDIPTTKESWGLVETTAVVQDELGFLWVDGNAVPRFQLPTDRGRAVNPGALVFWVETGIGVWVHPKSLSALSAISRLDMEQDRWLPINEVPHRLPAFIKENSQNTPWFP